MITLTIQVGLWLIGGTVLIPAVAIFTMAVLRIDVKIAMLVSILTTVPMVCLLVQHTPLEVFSHLLLVDYRRHAACSIV